MRITVCNSNRRTDDHWRPWLLSHFHPSDAVHPTIGAKGLQRNQQVLQLEAPKFWHRDGPEKIAIFWGRMYSNYHLDLAKIGRHPRFV
jgi:hypothetical protein